MKNRVIINKLGIDNKAGLVLNLKDLEVCEFLDLDKEIIISKLNESINSNDIELSDKLLLLLKGICSYDDKDLIYFDIKLRCKKIISKYEVLDINNFIENISLFLEISDLFKRRDEEYYLEENEELKFLFNKIYEIKKNLIDEKIILDVYNRFEKEDLSLKEICLVKDFSLVVNDLELNKKFNIYISKINKIICNRGFIKSNEFKTLTRNSFNNEFLNSDEFLNLNRSKFINEIENYEALLRVINNMQLIYKYNRAIDLDTKSIALKEVLEDYLKFPNIYIEGFIESIIEKNKHYNYLDEVLEDVDDLKEELIYLDKNNSIPI